MTLGERILILRRRHGWSQGSLARASGLNRNTIARLEQGDIHDLTGANLVKLAKALQCTTDQLLGLATLDGDEDEGSQPAVAAVA